MHTILEFFYLKCPHEGTKTVRLKSAFFYTIDIMGGRGEKKFGFRSGAMKSTERAKRTKIINLKFIVFYVFKYSDRILRFLYTAFNKLFITPLKAFKGFISRNLRAKTIDRKKIFIFSQKHILFESR